MSKRFFIPTSNDDKVKVTIVNMLDSFSDTSKGFDSDDSTSGLVEADDLKGYDLPDFINDFYDFLTQYQAKTDTFKDFSIRPSYVYDDVSKDEGNAIRYQVIDRAPAATGKTNMAFDQQVTRGHKWLLRDIWEDTKNPGYKVLAYTKKFENMIDISSWSKNARDAERAAYIIEELLDTYSYIFKKKGLSFIRYERRMADQYREASGFGIYGIPLRYLLVTTKVKLVYEKILESIVIETLIKKN